MDEMGRWGVDFTLAQVHLPRGHHLSTGLAQGYRGLHGSPKELKSSQEGRRPPSPFLHSSPLGSGTRSQARLRQASRDQSPNSQGSRFG